MDCREVRQKLATGQTGELTSRHLESCDACRKELVELKLLDTELDRLEDVEVSPYFITRVRQRVADRANDRGYYWLRRAVVPLGAAAFCLLASFTGVRLGRAVSARQASRWATSVEAQASIDLLDGSSAGSLASVGDLVFSGEDGE